VVRYDPCQPIHYVTNLAAAPATAAGDVAGAIRRVAAATGMDFVNDGPTTEVPTRQRAAYQPDRYGDRWAPVVIAWVHGGQTDLLAPSYALGDGGSTWAEAAGTSHAVDVTGDVVINADATRSMSPGFGAGKTMGRLLLHELGHVVGLGHVSDQTQVMYPDLLAARSADYGSGDLAGLAHLGRQAGCQSTPAPR